MPFLVYGTKQQRHIDHVYTACPNAQFSADQVEIHGYAFTGEGPIYAHLNYAESAAQPFSTSPIVPTSFFFRPDVALVDAKFTRDLDGKNYLGQGTIRLTKNVYVDTHWLNLDPDQKDPETSGAYRLVPWFKKAI
jgi:hypothetical protein